VEDTLPFQQFRLVFQVVLVHLVSQVQVVLQYQYLQELHLIL
jgi:hypothetical protein